MEHTESFIRALKSHDLEGIQAVPKADLHNHFVLGGSRGFIKERTGYDIRSLKKPLSSMQEMHDWNQANMGKRFDSKAMRRFLIEAAFVQATQDGVSVLEIGEDVWGLGEYFSNDIDELIDAFTDTNWRVAPEIELRLQIGLSRHCPVSYLMDCLTPFWGREEFYSIDLYGDELAQPIENFIPIYQKAKENGLRLKAHIGEWGTAEDVETGIRLLSLDEVQHGIAAAVSEKTVDYILEHKVRLNLTPTSNLLLGRVKAMESHPIGRLFRAGVDLTINSDDVLMFDSDVSKEYLRLYQQGVLMAEELDAIRVNGLKRV